MILLCPKCKNIIATNQCRKREIGITEAVFCQKCNDYVDAFVIETKNLDPKWSPKEAEPTEREEQIGEKLSQLPVVGALSVIGDLGKVTKFILLRFLVFGMIFLATKSTFSVSLQDPYFLAIISSASIFFMHISLLNKLFQPIFFLLLLPVVISEILLAFYYFLFLILDLVIVVISLVLTIEKYR